MQSGWPILIVMAALLLPSCTRRQNESQCITGDQKSCPCLGGGVGVQVCQADGTYAACECLAPDLGVQLGDDMTATANDDMAAPMEVDMARTVDLAETDAESTLYFPGIQADLDAKTCTASACHGTQGNGSVMYVKAMATVQADIDTNYMDVLNEVNFASPSSSQLLVQPGQAGSGHVGGMIFTMGSNDPTYQKWLAWIKAGAPKQ